MKVRGKVLIATLGAASLAVAYVVTSFDPRLDGMPFDNNGDYASPDGDCFGMSLLAIDGYLRRKAAGGAGAPPRIASDAERGDPRLEAAAAALQAATDADHDDDRDNPKHPQSEAGPAILEALRRIRETGVPELMGLYEGPKKDDLSHAVVLYGYRNGRLLIYDPDYPGEVIEWPWDPEKGFGPHPKAKDDPKLYGKKVLVSSTPPDRYLSWRHVAAARAAGEAAGGACVSPLPDIVASVTTSSDGRRVTIKGRERVPKKTDGDGEPLPPPSRAWLVIDGVPVASAPVRSDGSFDLSVPARKLAGEKGEPLIVLTTKGGAFAGFAPLPGKPPSATVGVAGALGAKIGR